MSQQQDFTQGNIFKTLILFSGPIMLTNLLQTSFQFTDSLWVGNLLGENALGSVAVSSTIVFTMLSFVIGLNNASLTILSQQKGQDNEEGLRRYLNAFVVVLSILSIGIGIAGTIFSEELLRLIGTPESMMASATAYLQINFLGMLFLFGYNFIATILRALGDSKSPMRFVAIAVFLNIILDPLFIAGFDWGIEGAAYATVVSQGSAFIYGLVFVLRRGAVPFIIPTLPKKIEVGLILKLGIPSGLQMAVISAGVAAIMSVVTTFGEDIVAGFSAAQRLDSLIMLPAMALGTAVNSMAGQNIGVGNWGRVTAITKYAVLYNFAVMLSIGVLIVIFAEYGIQLFIQDEEAVEFGTRYLQIVALCYPFLGINFVLNGIVRAAGAMYQVLVLNLISFWVLRYPLTSLFSSWLGDTGIAIGMGVSFIIGSLFAYLYYRYGKWREKELFKEE
ncbi:putative MATE family efflux protein [Geomicrobium halophilum]|uniref:Putative MATE family efflux protein n=1 Tax=Geomicrobium halophilum TaxID=549000 RepID=A0A841PWX6_9BACL|nr:MATE family efflux transporter [Geomicrobium halophilum]MBB6451061.1 putative MATE family efflux protein [Geomicrobium halophilum]